MSDHWLNGEISGYPISHQCWICVNKNLVISPSCFGWLSALFTSSMFQYQTSTYACQRNGGCCTRTNLPLTLAYARTIHKFQGQSAGPVDKGKIPNIYGCIICDPDKSEVEGRALGLFYTALSRATTLGDDDGLNSANYFTGEDFNEKRIRNLGKRKNNL